MFLQIKELFNVHCTLVKRYWHCTITCYRNLITSYCKYGGIYIWQLIHDALKTNLVRYTFPNVTL